MSALVVSLIVGIVGIVATRARVRRWAADPVPRDLHVCWVMGLLAILPAWLIAFVTLLEDAPAARPQLVSMVPWILSVAAGLVGAIGGEALVRREAADPEGLAPARGWKLGVWCAVPAWAVALIGHVLRLAS